jgi:hypothetical protein
MNEFNISPEFEDKVRKAVSTPGPRPEFISQLRNELANRPMKMRSRFVLKPVWVIVFVLVVAMLVISAPRVAAALKQLFGYVPGVGLVENTGNLRMLAEPVTVTRDGVTLTVKNVFVYEDRVELVYEVTGIDPSNDGSQVDDVSTNPTAFCGGVNIGETANKDGDAILRLPDGTTLERDYTGLYPKNVYAMTPVYKSSVPENVTEMTMILKCIPWAKLGAVPENWEVPFKLVAVPEGTVVGAPVIDVNASSEPAATEAASPSATLPSPQATFTLERVAQTDTGPIFYIRLNVEHPDPSMVAIFPRNVYVIDSLGQKIQLMNNTKSSEDPSTVYEYVPTAKPAEGALTLVVEDAVAKYAPLDETSFTFDVGENPQPGQTWELNKEFDIAGSKVEMVSARAATYSDIEVNPEMLDPQTNSPYRPPEGSQGFDYGYQFTFKIDPSLELSSVAMDILSESCGLSDIRPLGPSPLKFYTQLCRDGYPKGNVKVILRDVSVLVKNVGQVVWSPESASVPVTSVAAQITSGVKMNLERIIPMDSATVFYFSMDMENKDPSLISIMPVNVYVIDSLGQKIQLIGNFPWVPFEHRVGSPFEFTSQSKPADGPLTLMVENAVAYYAPLYVDPPQATPDEMSFTFEAGENPQYGQTWDLNKEFEIAGYKLKVTSARAANFDDIKTPDYILGSQGYEYGYEFIVNADPSVKMHVEMDIMSEAPVCWLTNSASFVPDSSSIHYIQLCRDEYPKGNVRVTLRELSILVENAWQATWTPLNK